MSTRRKFIAAATAVPLAAAVHRASAQDATPEPTPDRGKTTNDVVYAEAGGLPLMLDVIEPPRRPRRRPAVIVIHGGAWMQDVAERSSMSLTAQRFARAGYVTFNISYRLLGGPHDPQIWPAQLDDVQSAVRWVREHAAEYGVDRNRIGAFGLSAGAHLAAMLGVRDSRDEAATTVSSRVTCVAAHAGVMDMLIPSPDPWTTGVIEHLLGGTPEEAPAAYRDASPIVWVDENSAPFLLLHGTADKDTHHSQSREMAHRLRLHDVEVFHGEFPGLDHLQLVLEWSRYGPWTLEFFARHLKPD